MAEKPFKLYVYHTLLYRWVSTFECCATAVLSLDHPPIHTSGQLLEALQQSELFIFTVSLLLMV